MCWTFGESNPATAPTLGDLPVHKLVIQFLLRFSSINKQVVHNPSNYSLVGNSEILGNTG